MLGPSHHAYIFRHHFAHTILGPSTDVPSCRLPRPYLTSSRQRNMFNGTKSRSKGTILAPRTHPKRRLLFLLLPRLNKAESTTSLGKRAAKRAAAVVAAAQKASAQPGPATQPEAGNVSAAHLRPSHCRLLPTKARLGKAASINPNHRPRHRVKPHRRPLRPQVPPQIPVPPLPPHPHLYLRLRARKTIAAHTFRIEAVRGGPEWCWRHERWQQVGARSRKGER